MKLLSFGDFIVILVWNDSDTSWAVSKVFRKIPGRIALEDSSVSALSWPARCAISELCATIP